MIGEIEVGVYLPNYSPVSPIPTRLGTDIGESRTVRALKNPACVRPLLRPDIILASRTARTARA